MPIAHREMLLLARSPFLYRSRMTTGVVTLVAGIAFAVLYSRSGFSVGVPFFGAAAYALSMMCMFAGAQLTADAVAREKREGTLGLLLLTALPSWQIILGKIMANALGAFCGVFVTFPLLSLLIIVGGVPPIEVVMASISLLNTLFVAASLGICVSTFSLEQKRAAGRAMTCVSLLWWILPMVAQIVSRSGGVVWLGKVLMLFSLNSTFIPGSFGLRMGAAPNPWLNLLCTHALGWACLGLATRFLPSQVQERPERKRRSPAEWWKRLSFGSARVRGKLRDRLLERNPFLWLASRDRLRFFGLWLITCLILGLGGWIYFLSGREPSPLIALCLAATLIHRFMAASIGAAQLMVEQEQGTLEMLLSTPLSAREILLGQYRAAARQLTGPAVLVLILHALTLLAISESRMSGGAGVAVILVSAVYYVFDLHTALWLSMWGAVISRNAKQAAGAATGRLLGIPFFILLSTTLILAGLNFLTGLSLFPSTVFTAVSMCLLILVNNLYWLRRTNRELPGALRSYAFRRYSPDEELGFGGRLGRSLGRRFGRPSHAKADNLKFVSSLL